MLQLMQPSKFSAMLPQRCEATPCATELSLKFDSIAPKAGHHQVLMSLSLVPYWKYLVALEIHQKLYSRSYPTTALPFQLVCLFISTTKKAEKKMCQQILDDFVGIRHLASIKILIQPTRTYNIGPSSQGTTNVYTKCDAIMNNSQIYCFQYGHPH